MEIERIQCIPLQVPLKSFFETNFGRFDSRRILLVKVSASDGAGIAECPVFGPFYSYETVKTAKHIIDDYISEAIIGKEINDIEEYVKKVSFIRGHNFAKSGVELALWDALTKAGDKPLHKELGGVKQKIPSQISIGVKDKIEDLLNAIKEGLDQGYRQIKIKIHKGWDLDVVKQVRDKYPDIPLMVDANAGYTLDDLDLFKQLDSYDLTMIEQPLHYDDLYNHSKLQKKLNTPICLDESIHSLDDAKTAVELGSCQIVNIKVFRVGGLYETKRIQKFCSKQDVDVWCGGMIETGLGKAFNLVAASLPGFTLPNDITPSRTYFVDEIIEPEIQIDKDGYISLSNRPGLGYSVKEDIIEKYRIRC